MDILNIQNLHKRFGDKVALNNVSLDIPKGSIFGLLGPNGAGKTTMIRIINRIYNPDSGSVNFENRPITNEDVQHIGYMPEERGLYKKMKVGELLMYLTQLKGLSHKDANVAVRTWLKKFKAEEWWNMKVDSLSKGMQQKVQFIATVAHSPKLLILDEPFSGFDPINARLIRDEILSLNENGTTIIFSSHRMESVEELCSHVALINNAEIILNGQLEPIRKEYSKNRFETTFIPGKEFSDEERIKQTFPYEIDTFEKLPSGSVNIIFTLPESTHTEKNILLNKLMDLGEIEFFREVYPSMNDIFIDLVEGNHVQPPRL